MKPLKKPLLGVDSNFPIDLAEPREFALDALEIIKRRLSPARVLIPPTAFQELVFMSESAETEEMRLKATRALRQMRSHGLDVVNLVPVEHGIVARIADSLLEARLLPEEERNDALILTEAALLGCSILLTSDGHLRGMDFQRASIHLSGFDLTLPVIATPRELIAKFG